MNLLSSTEASCQALKGHFDNEEQVLSYLAGGTHVLWLILVGNHHSICFLKRDDVIGLTSRSVVSDLGT